MRIVLLVLLLIATSSSFVVAMRHENKSQESLVQELFDAIKNDDTEKAKSIAPLVDINTPDQCCQSTPLICAASSGNGALVEFFLTIPGIDVNALNSGGSSALFLATKNEHDTIVTQLLTHQFHGLHKMPGNFLNLLPMDIIHEMKQYQHSYSISNKTAKQVMEKFSRYNPMRSLIKMILDERSPSSDYIQEIDEKPEKLQAERDEQFIQAAGDGDLNQIEKLLMEGANINAKSTSYASYGRTPLHQLLYKAKRTYPKSELLAILKRLLQEPHIDVNVGDLVGNPPLYYAAYYYHPEIITLLLRHQTFPINISSLCLLGNNSASFLRLLPEKIITHLSCFKNTYSITRNQVDEDVLKYKDGIQKSILQLINQELERRSDKALA